MKNLNKSDPFAKKERNLMKFYAKCETIQTKLIHCCGRKKKQYFFGRFFFHFFPTSTNCARKRLEWIMNSVFNNSNEICCCNKEQCFTPTLLTWSSLQLSSKSFVNSTSETGNYYFLRPPICYIFLWLKRPT